MTCPCLRARVTRPVTTRARQDQRMHALACRPTRHAALWAAAEQLLHSGFRGETRTCRCGAPHTDHSGERHTGGCPATGCKSFRRDRAEQMAERMLAAADTNPLHDIAIYQALSQTSRKALHASDAGACPKSIWYRVNPPADYTPIPRPAEAATLGTAYHKELSAARRHLYPWVWYEQPVTLPGLAEEASTFDEYNRGFARIRDAKSAGDWMAREVEHAPYPKHVKQLLVYGYALTAAGEPVTTLELEYISRENGALRRHTFPYDHAAATAAIGELRAMAAMLDTGAELPRGEEYTGPATNVICAEYCPARDHCWNVPQAAALGRSPESLTILGPDPRVNEQVTAWALERAHATQDAAKKAEKAYKVAKKLLQGIPDGTYGGWVYVDQSRPVRQVLTWSAAARKEYLAWQATPAEERWQLGDTLALIPMTHRNEHRFQILPPARRLPRAA